MTIALYLDHHVHAAISEGLRQRHVDVLTALEDGTSDWDDSEILGRAAELGRVIFSQDRDFLVLAHRWQQMGRNFAGVVYGHQLAVTIGQAIRDLELIAKLGEPDEFRNRVEFIPL